MVATCVSLFDVSSPGHAYSTHSTHIPSVRLDGHIRLQYQHKYITVHSVRSLHLISLELLFGPIPDLPRQGIVLP